MSKIIRFSRKVISFLLVAVMVLSMLPEMTVQASSTKEDMLNVVYWNPKAEGEFAEDGVTWIAGGSDSQSGASKETPVASIEEATRIAADGATIFCMNTFTLTKDLTVGIDTKALKISRYKAFTGEMFAADGYALTLENVTIDPLYNTTNASITVNHAGCVNFGAKVVFATTAFISVDHMEQGISSINFLVYPPSSSQYTVKYIDENVYTAGNILADGSDKKITLSYYLKYTIAALASSTVGMEASQYQMKMEAIPEDEVSGSTIYISADGSDANTGLLKSKPVKTLSYAYSQTEKYYSKGILSQTAPITVLSTIEVTKDEKVRESYTEKYHTIQADTSLGTDPLIRIADGVKLQLQYTELKANSSTNLAVEIGTGSTLRLLKSVAITGVVHLADASSIFAIESTNTLKYNIDVDYVEKRGDIVVSGLASGSKSNFTLTSLESDTIIAFHKGNLIVTKQDEVYVDGNNGSDSNTGLTVDKPVQSIDKALTICQGTDSSWSKKKITVLSYLKVSKAVELDHGIEINWLYDNGSYYQIFDLSKSLTIKDAVINGRVTTMADNVVITLDDPAAKINSLCRCMGKSSIVLNHGSIGSIEAYSGTKVSLYEGSIKGDMDLSCDLNLMGAVDIDGTINLYKGEQALSKVVIGSGVDLGTNRYRITGNRNSYSALSDTPLIIVQGTSTFPATEYNESEGKDGNFTITNVDELEGSVCTSGNDLGILENTSTTDIYMSGTGDDTKDGSSPSKAVKSIERAKALLLDGNHDGMNIIITTSIYSFSSTTTWDLSGLSWTPIIKISPNLNSQRVFTIKEGGTLNLKNLTIDCQCSDSTYRGTSLIYGYSRSENSTIWPVLHMDHVTIKNASSRGWNSLIYMISTNNTTIKNVNISGVDDGDQICDLCPAISIEGYMDSSGNIDNYSDNIEITDTVFDGYNSRAIEVFHANKVNIEGCEIKNAKFPLKSALVSRNLGLISIIAGTKDATIKDCNIYNNVANVFFIYNTLNAIALRGSKLDVINCKIHDNTLGNAIVERSVYSTTYGNDNASLTLDADTEIYHNTANGLYIVSEYTNDGHCATDCKADIYASIKDNVGGGLYTLTGGSKENAELCNFDINIYGTIQNNTKTAIHTSNNSVLTIKEGAVIDGNGSGLFIDTTHTGRTTTVVMDGGCITNNGYTDNGDGSGVAIGDTYSSAVAHIDDNPSFILNSGKISNNQSRSGYAGGIYIW